jgi:Leucine-rich repeat (LRR) protein
MKLFQSKNVSHSEGRNIEVLPVTTAMLEDIPLESGSRHDQLPHIEDVYAMAAASLSTQTSGKKKKRIVMITACILIGMGIAITLVVFTTRKTRPSKNDSEDRLKAILKYLEGLTESREVLRNELSPQYRAAHWIAIEDANQVDSFDAHWLQRFALVTLYFSSKGTEWATNLRFTTPGLHECFWNQIVVDPKHGESYKIGVLCNDDKEVTSLEMDSLGLVGSLPQEMSHLTTLHKLSMNYNSLSGIIPDMQTMSQLQSLGLASNDFSSDLPKWIGKLQKLVSLNLSNNNFKSTIPTEYLTMMLLKNLDLNSNEISGRLDTLSQMTWLENLNLQGNRLTGSIENYMLSGMHAIKVMNLSNNLLAGKIHARFFRHHSLEVLALDGNHIDGSLPSVIQISSSLRVLTLKNNRLTGTIPDSLARLEKLSVLDLSQNELWGSIPTTLGIMSELTWLSLSDNGGMDTMEIPTFLRQLPLLQTLGLGRTGRTGTIPSWVGTDCPRLRMLDLLNNALTGSVPSEIGLLTDLQVLLLGRNQLDGRLPSELYRLEHLCKLLILFSLYVFHVQLISQLSCLMLYPLATLFLEETRLVGSDHEMCNNRTLPWAVLLSDCGAVNKTWTCPCCTRCCPNGSCSEDWLMVMEGMIRNEYERLNLILLPKL